MSTPMEARKKRVPAWPDESVASCSMAGKSGEKMKRLTKLKKNSRVRKTTVPATELNGLGVGHALAIDEGYHVGGGAGAGREG